MDEPAHRLPQEAKGYWRSQTGLVALPVVFGTMAFVGVWAIAVAVLAVAAVIVVPELRWRRWRYEIRDDEIDLRHGLFTVRRTLVPIRRVQHVDTEVGPLQGSFGLASVKFHTAAGATSIPALRRGEADEIRTHVGVLARTRDDV